MALLDDLSRKITKTSQDVVRGTKDFTDVARLNSLISDEQKKIANLYSQLGKLYYETCGTNADDAFRNMCVAIAACEERITAHNEEIAKIKGTTRCPSCGTDIPLSSVFCGSCGSQIARPAEKPAPIAEAEKKFCTGCGAELPAGMVFCTACGQKSE